MRLLREDSKERSRCWNDAIQIIMTTFLESVIGQTIKFAKTVLLLKNWLYVGCRHGELIWRKRVETFETVQH